MNDLITVFELKAEALGLLTSAVQMGFISGTLLFALLNIADRFLPSNVFFYCAIIAAVFNLGVIIPSNNLFTLGALRFGSGFFLAGIYPVGMKIAADYFDKGLGKSLGYLVGALVLGTAFPHALKALGADLSWTFVITTVSIVSIFGGLLMKLTVPVGPFRKPIPDINLLAFFKVFKNPSFKSAAFGYFGHMWELYTFWALTPLILTTYQKLHPGLDIDISIWSFLIIAMGSLGCAISGGLSLKLGAKTLSMIALFCSGLCCLLSPLIFKVGNFEIFAFILLFWGFMVVADSPLFSTLVAKNADPTVKGTALTIVNCIGFAITIVSIQFTTLLSGYLSPSYLYVLLAIGPVFGLVSLFRKGKGKNSNLG